MHDTARTHRPPGRTRRALTALATVLIAAVLMWPTTRTEPTPNTANTVVLRSSGTGSTVSATFATEPDWSIAYAFDCGDTSEFRVIARGDTGDGVALVDRAGTHGTGATYVHSEPGRHWLQVTSDCTWTLTVVNGDSLPRVSGSAV